MLLQSLDMQNDEIHQLKQRFTQLFGEGGKIRVVRAPGRVNLIGEHTDYNDGFVFPMAIEPDIKVVCRGRSDEIVKIASTVYPNEFVEFSLQKKIERAKPAWGNYARGVAAELIRAGIPLSGMDALISNSLPVGGGLSSSAAIEVGVARALLLLAGLEMEHNRLALICQKAEHEYAQVPCGIMDQMIVASARAGHAMMLDCRDLNKQFVPIDPKDLRVVDRQQHGEARSWATANTPAAESNARKASPSSSATIPRSKPCATSRWSRWKPPRAA